MDENGWQPIETAPKDGTRIIAAEFEGDLIECAYLSAWFASGEFWSVFSGQPAVAPARPTHWMPLPAPPQDQQ